MYCVWRSCWCWLCFWVMFISISLFYRKPWILILRYNNFIGRCFSYDWLILSLWCLRHILRFGWTRHRSTFLFWSPWNNSRRLETSQSRGRSRLINRAKIWLFLRFSILRIRWLKRYLLNQKIDCVVRCILVYDIAVLDRLWSLVFALTTFTTWITFALSIAHVISARHFECLED